MILIADLVIDHHFHDDDFLVEDEVDDEVEEVGRKSDLF